MAKLRTLRDALLDEVRDLYSAENQLVKALPKVEKRATSEQLKEAVRSHLEETRGHVERLEQIGVILGEKMTGKTCQAMKGLVEEAAEVIGEESDNDALIDALLIGAALRVEHYEMAGYGTSRAMAEALGEEEIATLLQETLDEEGAANKTLSEISESEILPACAVDADNESDNEDVTPTRSSGRSIGGESMRSMKGSRNSGIKS